MALQENAIPAVTALNGNKSFQVAAGKKIVVVVDSVEDTDLVYTVPQGKVANINIMLTGGVTTAS